MTATIRWGTVVFGVALAALGGLTLAYSDVVAGLEPIPASVPGRMGLAYLAAALLLVGGTGIATRTTNRLAAAAVALPLLVWLLALHLPALVAQPRNGGEWVVAFETLALFGAASVIACGLLPGKWESAARETGRIAFGLSLIAFGISHLVYTDYVASVIPAWLPGHYFWAYATAAFHLAAGAAILTRVKARLASLLLGAMFGSWVLIVHLPRVAHHPADRNEWTSLVIAMAMCGGAWVVASLFPPPHARSEAAAAD